MTAKPLSLLAALCLSAAMSACGNSETDPATNGTAADTQNDEIAITTPNKNSPGTQEMFLGAEDAPVTLIEYASTTCPHCADFHAVAFARLKEDYIDTGKVKLIFREFPTAPAQLSYLGSALARCAADKKGSEAYFAMLKTLFSNQRKWVSENFQTELLSYAAQAGLTEEQFRACVSRDEIVDAINDNVERGDQQGITGTPSFVLQGEKMDSIAVFEDFFTHLDAALTTAGVEPPAAPADEAADDTVLEQTEAAEPAAEDADAESGETEEETQ